MADIKTPNLDKLLSEMGQETVNIMVQKIVDGGHVRTGRLRDSIDFTQTPGKIIFEMVNYGIFIDKGTRYIQADPFFDETINEEVKSFISRIEQAYKLDVELEVEKQLKEI